MKLRSLMFIVLLLASSLVTAISIRPVRADGTITIKADGSVDPSTAPISSPDNITYTLTNNIHGQILVQRDNIVIKGNGYTLWPESYDEAAINLSGRTNVIVRNTQIGYSGYGIWFDSSSGNSILGNNISCGVWLNSSSGNSIIANNITSTGFGDGIDLESSSGNTISGNTFVDCGLYVYDSYQNSVVGNTVNGKPLVYLEGVSDYGVGDAGQVVLVDCDSIRVENLNLVSRVICSVLLWETSNSTISGNNIANNGDGVWFEFSSDNSVSQNIFTNDDYGVWFESSSGNTISGNTFVDCGLYVYDSYQNSVVGNTVNGKPLVYLEGVSDYGVGDAGQVVLVDCDSIRVENLNLSRASMGVLLRNTNNSIISGNNLSNDDFGIWLGFPLNTNSNNSIVGNNISNNIDGIGFHGASGNSISSNNITANSDAGINIWCSSGNSIVGNNITNNWEGIYLESSSDNSICHNDFLNNTNQVGSDGSPNVWDDGYPSGGNYWSDYLTKYPNAAEVDSSGIWNTPYVIDTSNVDDYPLMNQVTVPEELIQSSTSIACSPNPAYVGSYVNCTATVSGSNPTGTVTWSSNSSTGSFSQLVSTLSSGTCSTTYTDTNLGTVTITASYSGNSNNEPSSNSTTAYYQTVGNYAVSVSPSIGTVAPGGSIQANVTISIVFGQPAPITLYATGLAAGMTADFSPPNGSPTFTSTLTLSSSSTTPTGQYTIGIVASGGETTSTSTYVLTVGSPTGPILLTSISSDKLTIIQGQSGSTVLTIRNIGNQPLAWSLSCNATQWTSFSKTNGILNPQGEDDVQVCVNTFIQTIGQFLGFGSYTSRITIQGSQVSGSFASEQTEATIVTALSLSQNDQKDVTCNVVGRSDGGSSSGSNMIKVTTSLIYNGTSNGKPSYNFTMEIKPVPSTESGYYTVLLFDDFEYQTLIDSVLSQLKTAFILPNAKNMFGMMETKEGFGNDNLFALLDALIELPDAASSLTSSVMELGCTGLALSTFQIAADQSLTKTPPDIALQNIKDVWAGMKSTLAQNFVTGVGFPLYEKDQPYSPKYVIWEGEALTIVVAGLVPIDSVSSVSLAICGINGRLTAGKDGGPLGIHPDSGASKGWAGIYNVLPGEFLVSATHNLPSPPTYFPFTGWVLWGGSDVYAQAVSDPQTPYINMLTTYALTSDASFNSSSSVFSATVLVQNSTSPDFPGSDVDIFIPASLDPSNLTSFALTLNGTLIPFDLKYKADVGYEINTTLQQGGQLALSIPPITPTIAITPSYMGSLIVCGSGFPANDPVLLQFFNGSSWANFQNGSAVQTSGSGFFEFKTPIPSVTGGNLMVMAVGQMGECAQTAGTIGYYARANIHFDPNYLSGEWVTAYVEFPSGYNVSDVDPKSVMLNNTVQNGMEPYPLAIGNFNNNSTPDLMLQFNATDVSEYITSQGIQYGSVTLAVTGYLNDGTMFEGNATFFVGASPPSGGGRPAYMC